MSQEIESYRNTLIAAEQKSQDDYDKTIVSLSGGALGITLLFIENVIGDSAPQETWALISAWSFWAASLAAVVISYFFSRLALRKAIDQCDSNNYSEGVGGWATKTTNALNAVSGLFFVTGIIFVIIFCSHNLGGESMSKSNNSSGTRGQTPPPPPPARPAPPVTTPGTPTTGVIPPPPPPKPANP
ncbi:MAG: hypothetical protein REI12_06395 [Pedobacter sp.]|nr:hypothetical protein [Pedobacter sp.]